MICPQTKQKCVRMECYEGRTHHCLPHTPPPTMAEIERLLGRYVGCCIEASEQGLKDDDANNAVDESRTALLSAIQKLTQ